MAAGVLRNLRYITKDQFEQMDRTNETTCVTSLEHALGLMDHHVEAGRESLCSRLLALSIESLNRGLITHDEFDEDTTLIVLGEDQRQALLSQVTTKMPHEEKEQ